MRFINVLLSYLLTLHICVIRCVIRIFLPPVLWYLNDLQLHFIVFQTF